MPFIKPLFTFVYDRESKEVIQVDPPLTEEQQQERLRQLREFKEQIANPKPEPPKEIIPPEVVLSILNCKRCNATWTPRTDKLPTQCPKCRSPFWNKERVKH